MLSTKNDLFFGHHLIRFGYYQITGAMPKAIYPHMAEAVVKYLAKETNYPPGSVRQWLVHNELNGVHPFSGHNFYYFMRQWAGKTPGLKTQADVRKFASLGKIQYQTEIYKKGDFQEFLSTLPAEPLSPYWHNQFDYLVATAARFSEDMLARPEIEKEALEKVDFCRQNRQPLLVYGGAGSGKSTLMAWLYWNKRAEKEFGFERVWVRGEAGKSVTDWLRLLFHYFDESGSIADVPTALAQLKSAWGQSRWLVALDDCDNVEVLRLLAESLPPGSLLVASARTSTGAPAHFPLNCSLEVTGAAEIFALDLYRRLLAPVPSHAREWVQRINQAVKGNVLAMKLAFGLDVMEKLPQDDIACALEIASPEEQISTLLGMFSDRADATLAARARQLGVLPSLAACDLAAFTCLWQTDDESARKTLLSLTRHGILDQTQSGWILHESVRVFFAVARDKARALEQGAWLERYAQYLDRSGRWQQFLCSAHQKQPISIPDRLLPSAKTLPWRAMRSVFCHHYNTDWEIMQANSFLFHGEQFGLGYKIYRETVKYNRYKNLSYALAVILAIFLGAALIPNLASVHPAFILIGMVALFIFFAQTTRIAIIFDQRWDALFGNPATLQEPG